MPKEFGDETERTASRRPPEWTVSYWLARIIVGVFVAIGVAVLTFCFAWWHLSPSDDDLSMSFKIAGVVGGIFGLLVIVMGADILSVIDAVFFGGTRRR